MKSSSDKFNADFENAWQDALDDAEVAPPSDIWERVESDLSAADLVRYRQYYMLYRAIAAGFAVLAIAFSGLYFSERFDKKLSDRPKQSLGFAEQTAEFEDKDRARSSSATYAPTEAGIPFSPNQNNAKTTTDLAKAPNTSAVNPATTSAVARIPTPSSTSKRPVAVVASIPTVAPSVIANGLSTQEETGHNIAPPRSQNLEYRSLSGHSLAQLPIANELENDRGQFVQNAEEQAKAIATDVAKATRASKHREPKSTEPLEAMAPQKTLLQQQGKMFVNLNLGSDFFQPNFKDAGGSIMVVPSLGNGEDMVVRSATRLAEQHTPSASFSYGISMGTHLGKSKRWIVEGGVTYANYNTIAQTDIAMSGHNGMMPVTLQNNPGKMPEGFLQLDRAYTLNNSFEFTSIPLRAGYVIGNQHLRWIWKAGMSTGFFMRNAIVTSDGQLEPYELAGNQGTPYQRFLFNGMVSNEVNYAFNRNYSFAVEASYRMALNSFSTTEAFSSRPEAYGIGMVFRYHFN